MAGQESPTTHPEYDVAVIGGGPAGLSAAMYLGRSRRATLVLDTGQPRNAAAPEAHGVFTRDGTPPLQLLGKGRQQLARYPDVEFRGLEVEGIETGASGFTVRMAGGGTVRARRILLACGVRDELPPIEGLAEHWGTGVLHCAYCHGYEVSDRPLALYARGRAAVSTIEVLRRLSPDLLVCTEGRAEFTDPERDALARRNVRLVEARLLKVSGIPGRGPLALHFDDGSIETRAALFLSAPVRIASRLPEQLGCEFQNAGRLIVDAAWQTTVPGVYAAGDLAAPTRQVSAAAASGAEAGVALNEDLAREEAALEPAAIAVTSS